MSEYNPPGLTVIHLEQKVAWDLYVQAQLEYARFLHLPHGAPERIAGQATMALLRDLIAALAGTKPEDTQNYYESMYGSTR